MNQDEYGFFVGNLVKPGEAILNEMTPDKLELLHMAVGISGEAGELLDAIKKHVFYNKPIDMDNVIEELGDLEFYMEGLRLKLLITRAMTLKANMAKLNKRYHKSTFTNEQAQARADKVGEPNGQS